MYVCSGDLCWLYPLLLEESWETFQQNPVTLNKKKRVQMMDRWATYGPFNNTFASWFLHITLFHFWEMSVHF